MKIDKIQSNVMDLQEWIGPELKIKFETMEDYLNSLNITGLKAGYFEPMHLINLKSRHELSKAKDPRAAIFVRIANGLKERGYKGELHLYSKVEEIAKSLWGKNSERGIPKYASSGYDWNLEFQYGKERPCNNSKRH